ncbi:MAG: hypothetical protein RLZ83_1468 [Pseudomonadota bacterium]
MQYRGFESLPFRQNKTFEPAQRASEAPRAPHHAGLFCFGPLTAISVGRAQRVSLRPVSLDSTARRFGYGETAEPLLQALIERTPSDIDQVQRALPAGFSQEVADKVLSGLLGAARALETMPTG